MSLLKCWILTQCLASTGISDSVSSILHHKRRRENRSHPGHLIPIPVTAHRRFSSSAARGSSLPRLTHVDEAGRPSMVDVGAKIPTNRTATASGRIYIPLVAYDLVASGSRSPSSNGTSEKAIAKVKSKGDVFTVAQLAAIMGCKQTSSLIPLCHPLTLSHVAVTLIADLQNDGKFGLRHSIICRAQVSCEAKTGVEMEALTAVSVGLLTVWDMLKAVAGKEMVIGEIVVEKKEGGKSDFVRPPLSPMS
jgi:molybdenum cofactor biosynthesis protein MoaC